MLGKKADLKAPHITALLDINEGDVELEVPLHRCIDLTRLRHRIDSYDYGEMQDVFKSETFYAIII